jgi:hypothetical protein
VECGGKQAGKGTASALKVRKTDAA